MDVLVTGGAGFIGRWVVKKLIDEGHSVYVIDDFSNGKFDNISEFVYKENFREFIKGDIKSEDVLDKVFNNKIDVCYHLAAKINVQDSIDRPGDTFLNDVVGTFRILEKCKANNVKMVFMSTCMVYHMADSQFGITEKHFTKPVSPYAGSKIAAENLVLSYWYTYKLPVVILRPFNTYGPFQKANGEGGVVAIFIKRKLDNDYIDIYGDGKQTRDLLYVEDCAEFVIRAGISDAVNGEIVNAGSGIDITINKLANMIASDKSKIRHVEHIHPQSEIKKLLCNYNKAHGVLSWEPKTILEDGIVKTEDWIKNTLKPNYV